jgi:sigma-54 specific flagellar transcriptional regulator A
MKASAKTQIIGQSRATQFLRELIQTLAASSSTALVTGESGTGKELVAQALHAQGPRAGGPFVPINCGAIPRDLIESELFGHRKGAFTGAVADRLGRFELAHGGTLFLDEIGDLPMDMQVKLLRVLQERCLLPVGASREVSVDVRVVAATHKNLESEVAAGRFREDLYYRINVLPINTTALRERPEDIVALLQFYAEKHILPGNRPLKFAPDMMPSGLVALQAQRLSQMPTPAPQPSLFRSDSALQDALALAEPNGTPVAAGDAESPPWADNDPLSHLFADSDSPAPVPRAAFAPMPLSASNDEMSSVEEVILLAQGIQTLPSDGISLKQHLIDIERSLIEQALSRTLGNVSQTAKLLQLQRTTLIEKINKYELRGVA